MLTNADITLYNHRYNEDTRLDEWNKTLINSVHFYVDNKVSVGDNGLNSADVFKIRIPVDAVCAKNYISEDDYIRKPDVSENWTLQVGDYIVRGICGLDIEKPADLKKTGRQCCKIMTWSDNRFGSLPHWRIGGA